MDKAKTSSIDFDELRAKWPSFGFAAYAYEPDGPVTVEAIIQDEVIQARGGTLGEAVGRLSAMLGPTPAEDMRDALAYAMQGAPRWVEGPTVLYAERPGREILEFVPEPDVFG